MKKILFIKNLSEASAQTLFLSHQGLEKELDLLLKGALSRNVNTFGRPCLVTTNGAYPIARIVLTKSPEDIGGEKQGAFAYQNIEPEKLAFSLLKKNLPFEKIEILCEEPERARESFKKYAALFEGISLAKKITSSPANLMTPDRVAEKCQELENQSVLVNVLDVQSLQEIGAEGLLNVGKGSYNPPKMVVMEWKGSKEPPIALVGKGICYDSGGINLKNSHLIEMKWDKAGAGVVIGVMAYAARCRLPLHLVGVVPLAENMPDGKAMRPGDVIGSLGGKQIEIVDTDCEGRLVLADGIAYAQKFYAPQSVIDFGTLTLETFGALGGEYAGLFCNDSLLQERLIKAGEMSGEKVWPLPLGEYYARQIVSQVADLKNSGVFRYGASSAAAEFLRAFVAPSLSWAHLDISGTAWRIDAPDEGVSGFGVELMASYFNLLMEGKG